MKRDVRSQGPESNKSDVSLVLRRSVDSSESVPGCFEVSLQLREVCMKTYFLADGKTSPSVKCEAKGPSVNDE